MKKLFLLSTAAYVLLATSCNNNEAGSEETIVKDSMGVTTAPITDQVDSLAADTIKTSHDTIK